MPRSRPRWARGRWLLLLVGLALWLVLRATATPHAPTRGAETVTTSIRDLVRGRGAREAASAACLETHEVAGQERFKVGFVEFDDHGAFWSRDQLRTLETEFSKAAASPDHDGVLTLVFVHGWQHSAAVCDQNVSCFRDMLEALANAEDYRVQALRKTAADPSLVKPRYVFGVYVGWRGLSNRMPGLQLATFFARKATAHRVGGGDVIELFTRLESWRDRLIESGQERSKLVILGHSFGGAVTYTALSRVLHERLARAVAEGRSGPAAIRGFGDLVVLVNPAFEASLYGGLFELASQLDAVDPNQPAVLVTVSSTTDKATHLAFRVARFLATRFVATRDDDQAASLTQTIGNFEPYRTHDLVLASPEELAGLARLGDIQPVAPGAARGASDCKCDYFEAEVKAVGNEDPFGKYRLFPAHRVFGDTKLEPRAEAFERTPFITALTTDEVVSDHNGIYNRYFLNFLRSFLMEMDRRTAQAANEEPFASPIADSLEIAQ